VSRARAGVAALACAALLGTAWLLAPQGPLAAAEGPHAAARASSEGGTRASVLQRVPADPAGTPPAAPRPAHELPPVGPPIEHDSGDDPLHRYELTEDEGVLRRVVAQGAPAGLRSPFGGPHWSPGHAGGPQLAK
jgi:hypothetical protein